MFAAIGCAFGQEVTLQLQVVGPGAAWFSVPRPHLAGQSVTLTAEPVAGARFLGWADGVTNSVRPITIAAGSPPFVARFEYPAFNSSPDFSDRTLQAVSSNLPPAMDPPEFRNGRLRLRAQLPGRHGFRLLASTNLSPATALAPVAFANTEVDVVRLPEGVGGPGAVELWVTPPTNSSRGFYALHLDNGLTLPVLYFADVTSVVPGADVVLHGDNLAGSVQVRAGVTNLVSALVDRQHVRMVAPPTLGTYAVGLVVNGVQAIGSVPINVVGATNGAVLDALANGQILPTGFLRITGTNFGTNVQVWLDNQLLPIVSRGANNNELFVRLPGQLASGRLSVVSGGVRSQPLLLNFTPLTFTASVSPLAVVASAASNSLVNYTPTVAQLAVVASASGNSLANYTPSVAQLAVVPLVASNVLVDFVPNTRPVQVDAPAITPPTGNVPWTNGLGVRFVPVPGTEVMFASWETRVQDFALFAAQTGYDATTNGHTWTPQGWQLLGRSWNAQGFAQTAQHPAASLSWNDARAFCAWLTDYERQQGRIATNQTFRLPRNAEWDAAVGTNTYPWGEVVPIPATAGNYAGTETSALGLPTYAGAQDAYTNTAPIGSFPPNALGLYDLGGNVWEWTEETVSAGSFEVFRGCGWLFEGSPALLSSHLRYGQRDDRYETIGFRVVLQFR